MNVWRIDYSCAKRKLNTNFDINQKMKKEKLMMQSNIELWIVKWLNEMR